MESALADLFSKGSAQNLFIVRCDVPESSYPGGNSGTAADIPRGGAQLAIIRRLLAMGAEQNIPVKEVMEWNTSAELDERWRREEAEAAAARAAEEGGGDAFDAAGTAAAATGIVTSAASTTSAVATARPTTFAGRNAKDPISIAWGQLCRRKMWILCPFGSCGDARLLRSAAVEILCARTYECHRDFRVVLLCNAREFARLPRVVRVLSGLAYARQRYALVPVGIGGTSSTTSSSSKHEEGEGESGPTVVDEPMEAYLDYDAIELAADAPDLANFQEQVFNSDPAVRIVQYNAARYGRGDAFIRIMRDALKFNLIVHTLDMSGSKAGDVICESLTSVLHTTRKLRHLVLSDCSLTDAGIVELAAALRKNDAVWTLNVSKNPQITDVGVIALASVFAPGTRSRLEGLDISSNNLLYDTPRQWTRSALLVLWESLPRHPFLKYVSLANCGLGSHSVVDMCDRWFGRYRKVSYEEWVAENDPDVNFHTAALRRRQQKARRLKLQREQAAAEAAVKAAEAEKQKELAKAAAAAARKRGNSDATSAVSTAASAADAKKDEGEGDDTAASSELPAAVAATAATDFSAAADELALLEDEFLEPWEREKAAEERAKEIEQMRLENENRLFDSSLVSLNLSENAIGDAAIGLLVTSLPIGLKRLRLEHVSMGASGFRAIALALTASPAAILPPPPPPSVSAAGAPPPSSTDAEAFAVIYAAPAQRLQLEELYLAHNNSSLLTRRLLADADGADDYVTEADAERAAAAEAAARAVAAQEAADDEEIKGMGLGFLLNNKKRRASVASSYQTQQADDTNNGYSSLNRSAGIGGSPGRHRQQVSASGAPLRFVPPALEESDWARFYVWPPPKQPSNKCAAIGANGGSAPLQARPAVPESTAALFSRLASPALVAALQADAVLRSVAIEGWGGAADAAGIIKRGSGGALPAEKNGKGEAADTNTDEGAAAAVPSDEGANRATKAEGAAPAAAAATPTASSEADVPFYHKEEEGVVVRAISLAAPRLPALASLVAALEGNYRLHTLSLSATHATDEAVGALCGAIAGLQCGVRALDVSYNGNLGEASSHKIKELLQASGQALAEQQRDDNANANNANANGAAAATAEGSGAAVVERGLSGGHTTDQLTVEVEGGEDGGLGLVAASGSQQQQQQQQQRQADGEGGTSPVSAPLPSALKPPRPAPLSASPDGLVDASTASSPTTAVDGVLSGRPPTAPSPTHPSSVMASALRPPSSAMAGAGNGGGAQRRVTTPLVPDNSSADSPRRRQLGQGRLGGGAGGLDSGSPSAAATRPTTGASAFDDTLSSLNGTMLSSHGGTASTAASASTSVSALSTISSFFQDVEGNPIETDVGVLASLNLSGNAALLGERALLALYTNAGLQSLSLEGMGLTDGMLQPLGDACDASLRIVSQQQPQQTRGGGGIGGGTLLTRLDGRRRNGSYDSAQYEEVDPLTGAITHRLKLAHTPQQFFNPELRLTKVFLGNNTILRAGVRHLANFIRHATFLEELGLADVWQSFTDDVGVPTRLSETRGEGLYYLAPLLEALSGGAYACELLNSTFSSTATLLRGGSAATAARGRGGANKSITAAGTAASGPQNANLAGISGGWNRTDTHRSENNTWAAVAGRRAAAAANSSALSGGGGWGGGIGDLEIGIADVSAIAPPQQQQQQQQQQQVVFMAGSPASALKKGGHLPLSQGALAAAATAISVPASRSGTASGGAAGGSPTQRRANRINARAPTLRVLDLSENDLTPVVVLELVAALEGNEHLTTVLMRRNPKVWAGADAALDEAIAGDSRFVR